VITSFTLFKRRPDLDVASFRQYWQTTHRDLALQLPGLRRYVQHPTHDSGYRRHEPVYDGVAETWWDDVDALRALRDGPPLKAVLADEANLMDLSTRTELLTRPEVVLEGDPKPDALTMLVFVKRRPDMEPEAFHAYWRETHGPLGARVPGVRRYVQHHVPPGIYAAGRQPRYDGVAQTWFDDLDAMRAAVGTEERAATIADEDNFTAPGPLPFVVSTPIVMR
jgi:uncharacterized protein (TIGR02118 family)